jgi:hypothetical protein
VLETAFNYRETAEHVDAQLATEARAGAARIEQYLKSIESQVREVSSLPVVRAHPRPAGPARRVSPAPEARAGRGGAARVDAQGRERVRVSRVDPDRIDGGASAADDPAYRQARRRIRLRPDALPRRLGANVMLALRDGGTQGTVTLAEIDLKFVSDAVSEIRFGARGAAYVDRLRTTTSARTRIRAMCCGAWILAVVAAGRGASRSDKRARPRCGLAPRDRASTRSPCSRPGLPIGVPAGGFRRAARARGHGAGVRLGAAHDPHVRRRHRGRARRELSSWRAASRPILAVQDGAAKLAAGALETRHPT